MLAALVVAAVAIVSIVVLAVVRSNTPVVAGPLAVGPVGQPGSGTPACGKLMTALPVRVGGKPRRELASQIAGTAAWGDPAVILRCGLESPAELTCSAELIQINVVSWLELSAAGQTTYIAADRTVRIAVTVPDGLGTGAVQDISNVVTAVLPLRQPCSGGRLLPLDVG